MGCPRNNPRYEIYAVSGTDTNGHELEFYGVVDRSCMIPTDTASAEDDRYDIGNLRLDASYEVPVAKDVWWVPVSTLGTTRYTNFDIAARLNDTPEEKQATYSTLYEALQLFEVSNFYSSDDNQRIWGNGIDWEHHKPGYDAVRTNNGCCASDSNWLNYILKDDYDEVGFLAYSQTDGSGHILNYIKQDGFYYFIDLTHYRTDFLDAGAVESGILSHYHASDFISGNLHKAASPEAYAKYCVDCFNDPPGLFFLYQQENCLPVTSVSDNGYETILYPNNADIMVVYDNPRDRLRFEQVEPPVEAFRWSQERDAVFIADDRYMTAKENKQTEQEAFGLQTHVGDVFTLANAGDRPSSIEVGGIKYRQTRIDDRNVNVGFRIALCLYGGCTNSYYEYEFPMELHQENIQDMETVWVGDYMLDTLEACDRVQIVRCVEWNGQLVVCEVLNQTYHVTDRIFLERNENGDWKSSETTWDLIAFERDGKVNYRYCRLGIGIQ